MHCACSFAWDTRSSRRSGRRRIACAELAAEAEVALTVAARRRAYLLLRHHGQTLCRRTAPMCQRMSASRRLPDWQTRAARLSRGKQTAMSTELIFKIAFVSAFIVASTIAARTARAATREHGGSLNQLTNEARRINLDSRRAGDRVLCRVVRVALRHPARAVGVPRRPSECASLELQ